MTGATRLSTTRAGRREWAALTVLCLAVLAVTVDGTVLGLAVPSLTEDLAPTGAQLLWIVDIYSFVLAGLLITAGALGDRIGRRRLLLWGAAGFGLASVAAACATTPDQLIAARAVLGVAGATLMPSTLSLIRNIFLDARQRSAAIGVWAAMAGTGAAIGPILGGWLLAHFWWGSVFLLNLPVMLLLLVLGRWLILESRDPNPGRFDLPSAALSLASVLPVVYAIKRTAEGGFDPVLIGLFVLGVGLGVLFVRRQRRLAAPMIDISLFRNPRFTAAVVTNLISIFALVGALFFGSQFLQLVMGFTPLEAGLRQLPAAFAALIGAGAATALVRSLSLSTLLTVGLAVAAAGLAVLACLGVSGGDILVLIGFGLVGAGTGVSLTLASDTVVAAVPAARAGAASGISETAYELGTALGTALLGSLLNAIYRGVVRPPAALPTETAEVARNTLGGAVAVAAHEPDRLAAPLLVTAREAFTTGLRATSLVGAVLVVIAAVAGWLVLRRDRLVP